MSVSPLWCISCAEACLTDCNPICQLCPLSPELLKSFVGSSYLLLRRGSTSGPKKNANQNNNYIPPYSSQNEDLLINNKC